MGPQDIIDHSTCADMHASQCLRSHSREPLIIVQAACVRRMYDALPGAKTPAEREIVGLLLATLDPQALLDAGQLAEFETALR